MSKTIINGKDVSEEIIIDKINVAECKYLINDRLHNCECKAECTIYPETVIYDDCKGINCYFKQLKRLQEENEKLKEILSQQQELDNEIEALSNEDKYKQALEKTRDILCNGRTFYEGYFDNPNLSRTDEAIKVIDGVLNERHR